MSEEPPLKLVVSNPKPDSGNQWDACERADFDPDLDEPSLDTLRRVIEACARKAGVAMPVAFAEYVEGELLEELLEEEMDDDPGLRAILSDHDPE